MNTEPLVSVIIPIYNVEEYLRECLDSVCGQVYRNLEIIMVNDGSTDGSQIICEEYAAKDSRIKLIVKENGGLSSARNAGLKNATGDYIGFVDSDDMLHPLFVRTLINAVISSGSDIALCDCCSNLERFECRDESYSVISREEAISGLLDDRGYKCCSGTRLFRKNCFEDLWYPEGVLFEDIKIMYRIFKRINKAAYVRQPIYYYRMRKGSITKSAFSSKYYFLIESLDYVLEDSNTVDGVDHPRVLTGYMSYYMGLFVRKGTAAGADIDYEKKRLKALIRENTGTVIRAHTIKIIKKIELLIFAYFPHLYAGLVTLYIKMC